MTTTPTELKDNVALEILTRLCNYEQATTKETACAGLSYATETLQEAMHCLVYKRLVKSIYAFNDSTMYWPTYKGRAAVRAQDLALETKEYLLFNQEMDRLGSAEVAQAVESSYYTTTWSNIKRTKVPQETRVGVVSLSVHEALGLIAPLPDNVGPAVVRAIFEAYYVGYEKAKKKAEDWQATIDAGL